MIAVCVTLDIAEGRMDSFLTALRAHGSRCLDREPGCHRFDIATGGHAGKLFIYELYGSHADFEAHLRTDHFTAFDAEVSPMVLRKDVVIWDHVEER